MAPSNYPRGGGDSVQSGNELGDQQAAHSRSKEGILSLSHARIGFKGDPAKKFQNMWTQLFLKIARMSALP